ncbi:immunity 49 family protein [Streptomyces europaeiscabiei]|uniref:immunity 49 family protein n=1 Tax=Streptomyces europaeiscabiei TaxID=146819 RepID=UPI0029ACC0BF|nr:immunity 49 family protein [Streptomyces europaeiscabiei]MDX2525164.1 immunity 49 family protein [Streptomyces europaeiscabiei]
MAVTVPRHDFPLDGAEIRADKLDMSARRRIDALEGSSDRFNLALGTSMLAAQTHCAADPRAANLPTWEAWVTAMQVGSALFASATITQETVSCRIADKVRTIPATGPQHYTDAGNWLTAFWLAVVCREQDRMDQLVRVPVSLLRDSGAVFDDYVYAWVQALQSAWLRGGDIGDLLTAALDGTAPEALRVADPDLVQKVLYPPINLFYRYVARQPDEFNEALADALRWHKDYWTQDEERNSSSSGLVALGPLAVACLARDVGFPIDVESEYLPKHLLEGSWLNEFET